MRNLIALVISIFSVYIASSNTKLIFGGFVEKSKIAIQSDTLHNDEAFNLNFHREGNYRQGIGNVSESRNVYTVSAAEGSFASSRVIQRLTGKSVRPTDLMRYESSLPGSYTVDDLVGACAYDCYD